MGANILYMSGYQIYPPFTGAHMRASRMIRGLADLGCNVRVFSMSGRRPEYQRRVPSCDQRVGPKIVEFVHRSWGPGLLQGMTWRLKIPPLWQTLAVGRWPNDPLLREWLDWSDTVMVNDPYLYRIWEGHPAKKKVLVSHNLEHDLWRDGGLRRIWARPVVRRIEERAGRRSDLILACGPEDASFYRDIHGDHRATIEVPNGVFLSDYPRLDPGERHHLRAQMGFGPQDLLVLFVASKYGPNLEGLGLLKRLVREQKDLFGRGRLTFVVVGSVASQQDSATGLMCVGQVPSILPYLQTADLAINPVTTGGGTNVKMFDYIAAGLPILTTAFGARGLDLRGGEDCVIFDQDSLAASLADLLSGRDHGTWRSMAVRALEQNAARIDMAAAMRSLFDVPGNFWSPR